MVLLAISLLMITVFPLEAHAEELASTKWLTAKNFRRELDLSFSMSCEREELRQLLSQISTTRQISILLDRRLDPSAEIPFDVSNVTLAEGLTKIANVSNGDLVSLENLVFVGPNSATKILRTLIELREIELESKEIGVSERRRGERKKNHRTIVWSDLTTPHEILEKISSEFRIRISNREIVPHDLWAAAVLPDVSAIEALTVVLIQFDLTFRWADAGSSIELIPTPESVSLERKHRPKQKPSEALSLVRQRFPGLDVEVTNSDIVVRGLVEDHEAVSNLLRGDHPTRKTNPNLAQPVQQRLFTFSSNQPVPITALIKKLEESDIRFEYNPDEFKAAGIDLEQTVQVDVKNASADVFFKSIFGTAQIDFQFSGQTVKLKPKPRPRSQN
jgi:hypothetical protein